MLTKERPSGMYRLSAYYAARCLADLPVEVFNTTLFVTIVYFFGGLRLAAGAFFGNLLAMLLIVLVAQVIEWGSRGTGQLGGSQAAGRASGQHAWFACCNWHAVLWQSDCNQAAPCKGSSCMAAELTSSQY